MNSQRNNLDNHLINDLEFDDTKLFKRIFKPKTSFGEKKIRNIIRKDRILSKANAQFTNKPPFKTIQVKKVFE